MRKQSKLKENDSLKPAKAFIVKLWKNFHTELQKIERVERDITLFKFDDIHEEDSCTVQDFAFCILQASKDIDDQNQSIENVLKNETFKQYKDYFTKKALNSITDIKCKIEYLVAFLTSKPYKEFYNRYKEQEKIDNREPATDVKDATSQKTAIKIK